MTEDAHKTRWARALALASAPPIEEWPVIRVDLIEDDIKERVIRKIEALKQYVAGHPLHQIKLQTGVCPSALPKTLQRCLELSADGRIMGFRAILPNTNIYGYNRKKVIGFKRGEEHGGMSGALAILVT